MKMNTYVNFRRKAEPMRSAYLSLGVDTDAEAERIFAALSEGGEVFMPLQGDVLRHPFRPAARPVRHQLDDRPRTADDRVRVMFVTCRRQELL